MAVKSKTLPVTNQTTTNKDGLSKEELFDLVENAISSRAQLMRRFFDPRRDIDDECGYPSTSNLTAKDYQDLYEREPLAARTVQVFPKESWKIQPCIYEDEDIKVKTAFEEAWNELGSNLAGVGKDPTVSTSWHKSEHGSNIWSYLKRADQLCGIGHFGIILLGLNDGRPLSDPVRGFQETNSMPILNLRAKSFKKRGKAGSKKAKTKQLVYDNVKPYSTASNPLSTTGLKLLYLRVFSETHVEIIRYESNPTSPRFGQPVAYNVTLTDPRDTHTGIGVNFTTAEVHWTRIIHVTDNLESSEIFGVPRMRPVLNPLLDTRKVRGGSAEMYWRGAFPGLSFETHPSLGGDVEINREAMKTMAQDYMNGLQRYLALTGMTAKSLAPQVVDPTPQIRNQIEAICIYLGIPLRVFMGSERGQLASNQDDSTWNERLVERQNTHLTPRLIVPFIDRLILLGVLPVPKSGTYTVWWPDLSSQTEKETTVIAVGRTKAISSFHKDGLVHEMTFLDFLVRILKMSEQEAETIIKNRKQEPIPKNTDPALVPKSPTTPGKSGKLSGKAPSSGRKVSGGKGTKRTARPSKPEPAKSTTTPRYGRRRSQQYASDTTTNP